MTGFNLTPNNKVKWVYTILFLFTAVIIFYSCDDEGFSSREDSPQKTQWAPNIKYGESYDEKSITFVHRRSGGIVRGFQKNTNSDNVLLADYKNIRKVIKVDENGYMSIKRTYIEGNGDIHMPEETYQKYESNMPAYAPDHDPIVESITENGVNTIVYQSGTTRSGFTYDLEEMKVDTSQYDSLFIAENENTSEEANNKISENYLKFKTKSNSFTRLSEQYLAIERKVTPKLNASSNTNKIVAEKQVIDLNNGTIIRSGLVDVTGKIVSMSFLSYKKVNGFWFNDGEIIYEMGIYKGRNFHKYTTHIERSNIQIHYKR